jgi:MipA family protein
MIATRYFLSAMVLKLLCGVAFAQTQTPPPPPAETRDWEGAIGLLASNGPAYAGADERKSKLLPGFYVRYGRLSLTNASGFITRNNDEVVRGLGLDLSPNKALKLNIGLRFDGGRSESNSAALRGLGPVKATVRARFGARWDIDEHWRLGGAWSTDLLGRGGGHFLETSLAREQRWSADTTWAAGVATSYAGTRYLQSYFGITPEQSARTGYRVYNPSAGLRDATLFINGRSQVAPRWVALMGASATRLLGPAADSPLTRQPSSLAINAGLAWTF